MAPFFWISILLQLAAFGGVAHITYKTRRLSWGVIAVAVAMMLLRRGMEYSGQTPAHNMAMSMVVSVFLLWGMVMVHREHRREVCDLRALADAVPNMVWVASRGGDVEYVNRKFVDYTGRKLEEVQNYRWLDLVHPDDAARVLDNWVACVKAGIPYESEHRVRASAAGYRWFLARAVPVRHNGKVERWYGTATDIHDAKLAFEKLKAARD